MTSAAKYLHTFFTKTRQEQARTPFRQLYEATTELEDELKALKVVGGNVQPYLALIPRLRAAIYDQLAQDMSEISGSLSPVVLEDAELSLLELAIERTALRGEMTESRSKTLKELLSAVRDLATSDESIDPQLRLFIARSVLATENALDEYEITGEFRLRDALLNLLGLLRTAEASSDDPSRWQKAWEQYGAPATAGLIASIPQVALSGVALMQALSA